jgi:hypothetical protein
MRDYFTVLWIPGKSSVKQESWLSERRLKGELTGYQSAG